MSDDEDFKTHADIRALIIGLRGEPPLVCDFCHRKRAPETMHPEEGGEWACEECLRRWEEQERKEQENE